jgi:ubiquinone/menaquinone biosynthesis C-methylase UbiE/predicted transcriptional regulator
MEDKSDIMAVARAFMRSRIILTAAELDLFTIIQDSPSSAEKMAEKLGLDPRALARVMECLATFGLLNKDTNEYSLTDQGALLSSKHPASSLPMLLHMSRLWVNWSDLTGIVQKKIGSGHSPSMPLDRDSRQVFIGAMHVVGRTLSEDIAVDLDLSGYRKLLDIGGGSGTYTIALLRRNPEMKAILFDLKEVIEMARERLSSEGLLDRAELIAGDFYADELPGGSELALLSAIIHQNSREQNVELFKKTFRALVPGGAILVRDHIMNEQRTWPPEGAMFAINMLVNTAGGDTYTFLEVEQDLRNAGFKHVKLVRSGEKMDSIVKAEKPK